MEAILKKNMILFSGNTWFEWVKKRDRLFPVAPSDRTRGNEQKLKHSKFRLNIRLFYLIFFLYKSGQTLEQVVHINVSILWDIQNLTGHGPEKPADCGSSREVWLDDLKILPNLSPSVILLY